MGLHHLRRCASGDGPGGQHPALFCLSQGNGGYTRAASCCQRADREPGISTEGQTISAAEAREIQRLAYPDKWAEHLRLVVDAHLFDPRGREYEVGILRDVAKYIIVPKGAQLGLTTTFLVKCIHAIVNRRWNVGYLLPVKNGSVAFVQARIDPIIDSAKPLKDAFSRTDNRSQKQTVDGTNWYIRGTNIETELREFPADVLVLDERDKMNEENLPHAFSRLDGSSVQRVYELSTPTIDGFGVYRDNGFPESDRMQWWVPCPYCGTKQVLSFDENVLPFLGDTVEESKESCRCSHCRKPLSDNDRANMNGHGVWVPENPQSEVRGYHINQLSSPTKRLADPQLGFLVNYFLGQTDSKKLKEFYNLNLGLPYAAPGDKFTTELLDKCRGDYALGGIPAGDLYIGIDQGQEVLHVTIYTHAQGKRRLWQTHLVRSRGAMTKWQVLEEDVLSKYPQWLAVCDAHPDKEAVETLSKKYPGRFWMGFEKDRPDQETTANFMKHKHGEPAKVNIDRTMAFDALIKTYLDGISILPRDAREIGEYMPKLAYNGFYHQHLQMVRVEQPDAQGRMVARWVNGNQEAGKQKTGKKPDHWHHSDMFALVASMERVPLQVAPEVGNLFVAAGGLIANERVI